ncbi:hypothetical protein N0V93_006475 [Gnomoniopsis smithogilvyi]|uniref:Uncharacterized protein n=1 Tax=Gnomoniopsis smithogilvyi TaxID=1191159 RepID=A0A9W9CUI6_9PEZI|nr:hypothetical protein N0V93_006475 [Gnomoniopsis smithogilvyi]
MANFATDPATGLPIPGLGFPPDIYTRLKRLGYDHAGGLEYDWGDCAHAWYVLGLDRYVATAAAPVPSQADFENYCQCLLAKVPTIVSVTGVSNNKNTRRRYRMILMAIKTLSGHQRTHLNDANPDDWTMETRFPQANDLNLRGIAWDVHMARTIRPGATLPLSNTQVFRSQSAANIAARQARRQQYKATQREALRPTAAEIAYNDKKIREAEWEFANRHTDFAVQDDAGRNHFVTVVPCCRNFNNSLWHALSYQVNGHGLDCGKSWQGLRGGRREKAWLYNYFMSALMDPTHIRHRAYTWMQQNEKTMPKTQADKEILATWGELSILRALATNRPHAGRAKWPAFPGIFQLISDFFRMEVIVFVGNRGLPAPPVAPKQDEQPLRSSWRLPYAYHVFGKHEYGTSRGSRHGQKAAGNGQLFFVTDNEWQHFDAVKFPKFSSTDATDNFDTSKTGNDHRYGNRNFPFFVDYIAGKYAGGQLPDIPAPMGPAMGPGGRVWCPADDMAWRLRNVHPFVRCCRNDWDIVDARGNGQMPRLPTLDAMSEWGLGVSIGAPPMNVAPTIFEPWLVTSGGYYPEGDVTRLPAAGVFHDNVAKRLYDALDTLNAQGHQVDAGDRVQEPNELEVIAGNPHIQYRPRKRIRRGR